MPIQYLFIGFFKNYYLFMEIVYKNILALKIALVSNSDTATYFVGDPVFLFCFVFYSF